MIDVLSFRTRFGSYSDESEFSTPLIQMMIDDTVFVIGEDELHWQGKYDIAQSYLAAHYLAVNTLESVNSNTAVVGPVTSKSVAGVSVTRAAVSVDRSNEDSQLSTTSYGLRYLSIRDSTFVGVLSAN